MPKIYDNIKNHLTHGLNESLQHSKRTDFCVGYFYLSGWKQVAEKIDTLDGGTVLEGKDDILRYCRLLVGMNKSPLESIREHFAKRDDEVDLQQGDIPLLKKKLALQFKEQLTVGTPSDADERVLRKLSQQMKDKRVVVKLHLRHPLHAKLYLCYQKERNRLEGFVGSSNLTLSGLEKQGELNVDVLEQDAAIKLAEWFDDRWNDRWCIDITQELIEIIDNSWAADRLLSPYHIYLKMAYHLSQEARAGLNEYSLPAIFQKELLDFQQAAVKIAAKKLDKRDGVFIGDVVGLGKTITACALAKMFEERSFWSTLIICPPNLISMWQEYVNRYDLKARIISIGAVQNQLREIPGRFKIVIIDESHNLRNDQGSRYRAIKNFLDEIDGKVILLSATPYNKSFIDLSNQLRLFIQDDKDLGISPERYIGDLGGQVKFMEKHSETFIRSIKAFEQSTFADDWRELMRLYMVRRTRSFIKTNYGITDPTTGKIGLKFPDGHFETFPERVPKKVEYEFNPDDKKDIYAKLYSQSIVDAINKLDLARYGLKNYLEKAPAISPTEKEKVIIANLSRAGKRLMGFCRTNLFKRLESSGFSFLLSLSRHILRNYVFVYAIENKLLLPIGKSISQNLDDFLEDSDTDNENENENELKLIFNPETYLKKAAELYKIFKSPAMEKQFDWIRSEFFSASLAETLISDANIIIDILKSGKDWTAEQDRKLNALRDLLTKKHKNEKVLVFTQFADTAYYLTENMKEIKKLESVTGDSENPTALAHRFSPVSNNKPNINQTNQDLSVLISTDVLSEGQNLQDAHIILNYDLPWAIIRLIQRAGRVDRIGQKAAKILCYSFLPEDGIERIINLRGRLKKRIHQNAEVIGSDEVFFDGDPINIADLYNEKSGMLDDDETDTEVDLSSFAFQIWSNAIKEDSSLKKTIPDLPNVVYATKHNLYDPEKAGVIIYTRTYEENDVLAWLDNKGKIITQSQLAILKAAECTADIEPKYKLPNHHELVKKGIDFIREDERNTSSSLGKKTGVKFKTYTRLKNFCDENEGTLFVNEALKKAVDDILNFPMKEFAKDTINRHLKSGINDDELAALVVSLREEDKLCIVDSDEQPLREPHIICSLGLTNS